MKSDDPDIPIYDYIVVGAGSAGAVLAARLSEDPRVRVALLETGGTGRGLLTRAPLGALALQRTRLLNDALRTLPQSGLADRSGHQPRGRGLGGSSAINGMLYVRGHRWDYDQWAARGNPGWSYAELLPYFKRAEHNEQFWHQTRFHGCGGPLNVTYPRHDSPLVELFLAAAQASGLPLQPDYNGEAQEGAFRYQVTQRQGERCSAADAYLRPNLQRRNLALLSGATVARVLLGRNRRALGVELLQGGERRRLHARREVILSAGAFGSPQLLMLSGIGPLQHLQQSGVPPLYDLPGVGTNLQDHLAYAQSWRCKPGAGAFGLSWPAARGLAGALRQWRQLRSGPLCSPLTEAGAFLSSCVGLPAPDLQLSFSLALLDDHGRKLHRGHGFTSEVTLLRPHSRGEVRLAGPNPRSAPLVDPRFLSDPRDLELMVTAAQLQQCMMEGAALDEVRGEMLHPVDRYDRRALTEDLRARAGSQCHPVGTCRMGPATDRMAVVDERLRVRGLAGLRVVDASIFPTQIGGHTNATVVMIGERAADLIKADWLVQRRQFAMEACA